MTLSSKFTGLIIASGPDTLDPTTSVLETLSPFSVSILTSSLIYTRDRFILTFLIELNPDHQEAIGEDLEKLNEIEGMDLAYEFSPFAQRGLDSLTQVSVVARLADTKIHPSVLFSVRSLLNNFGELKDFSVKELDGIRITEFEISLPLDHLAECESSFKELCKSNQTTGLILRKDKRVVGGESILFDMDSTFINEEVIDIIAELSGVGEEIAKITESAMRGEMDFSQSLLARVALLRGKSASILEVAKEKVTLTEGIEDLIAAIHARGGSVGVVSGGFHDVIDSILEPLGVDFVRANRFEIVDGRFTGKVSGEIIDRQRKRALLREFSSNAPISIAVGDGANDIEMLDEADIGIAFCAKPALIESADSVVFHRDMRIVLGLLSY